MGLTKNLMQGAERPSSATATAPAAVFARHYRLERVVATSATSAVWRATDERNGEWVAVKFFPPELIRTPTDFLTVRDVIVPVRRLHHPQVVAAREVATDPDFAAIIMPWVEAPTLTQLRLAQPGQCFEVADIESWMRALVGLLESAHADGFIHGAIESDIIFIRESSGIGVAGFGINAWLRLARRALYGPPKAGGHTANLSPAVRRGEVPRAEDDVFAFGALIYELLTGSTPRSAGRWSTSSRPAPMAKQRPKNRRQGAAIPPAWEAVVQACLEPDGNRRPSGFLEIRTRLGFSAPVAVSKPDEASAWVAPAVEISAPPLPVEPTVVAATVATALTSEPATPSPPLAATLMAEPAVVAPALVETPPPIIPAAGAIVAEVAPEVIPPVEPAIVAAPLVAAEETLPPPELAAPIPEPVQIETPPPPMEPPVVAGTIDDASNAALATPPAAEIAPEIIPPVEPAIVAAPLVAAEETLPPPELAAPIPEPVQIETPPPPMEPAVVADTIDDASNAALATPPAAEIAAEIIPPVEPAIVAAPLVAAEETLPPPEMAAPIPEPVQIETPPPPMEPAVVADTIDDASNAALATPPAADIAPEIFPPAEPAIVTAPLVAAEETLPPPELVAPISEPVPIETLPTPMEPAVVAGTIDNASSAALATPPAAEIAAESAPPDSPLAAEVPLSTAPTIEPLREETPSTVSASGVFEAVAATVSPAPELEEPAPVVAFFHDGDIPLHVPPPDAIHAPDTARGPITAHITPLTILPPRSPRRYVPSANELLGPGSTGAYFGGSRVSNPGTRALRALVACVVIAVLAVGATWVWRMYDSRRDFVNLWQEVLIFPPNATPAEREQFETRLLATRPRLNSQQWQILRDAWARRETPQPTSQVTGTPTPGGPER